MIETSLSPTLPATVLHRVGGAIDQRQAEQGAAEALRFVQQQSRQRGPVDLVLDLRGKDFQALGAHKAWSQGFARNPGLHGHVRRVAIVDRDTPAFRAERDMLETDRVRFFADLVDAYAWLSQGVAGEQGD
jgi:hypothetical protein